MKSKIMILMLGFSLMLFGATIAQAEVSAEAVSVLPNLENIAISEQSFSVLKSKISSIEKVCSMLDACDNALLGANIAFGIAVVTCNSQGYGSSACESAMGVALEAANVAATQCNQSTNIKKDIPINPKENIGKIHRNTSG